MSGMRGDDRQPDAMFSYVSAEQRVPQDHRCAGFAPWSMTCCATRRANLTACMRAWGGRRFAPERLLRVQLLQIFYSIRGERLLVEQLDYNLLFPWFVGMDMDERIWDPTVFTKNRDRLLNQDIAVERGKDPTRVRERTSC